MKKLVWFWAIFSIFLLVSMSFQDTVVKAEVGVNSPTVGSSISLENEERVYSNLGPMVEALMEATPEADRIDTDSDGLYDSVERVIGTNWSNPDSDFDLLNDSYEAMNDLDPMYPDSNKDGLSDYHEMTNVSSSDVDGDGILNGRDPDNDNDGVKDILDLSPFAQSVVRNGFQFDIKTEGKPTYLTFQVRPGNPDHLKLANQFWDWPYDDKGEMQDIDNSKEDVKVTPTLDFTVDAYYKVSSAQSGLCLEVDGASSDPEADIFAGTYTGEAHQLWKLEPAKVGYVTLTNKHSGLCMEIGGASLEASAPVCQNEYTTKDNQIWALEPEANGQTRLTVPHSGYYLEAQASGNGVYQAASTTAANQKWTIELVGDQIPDQSEVAQYGIVNTLNGFNVQLYPVYDKGDVVAFSGKLFLPASGPLELPAEAKLVWSVQGFTDDATDGSTSVTTLASYEDDFKLTGLRMCENYGSDAGIIYSTDFTQSFSANYDLMFEFLRNSTNSLSEAVNLLTDNYDLDIDSQINSYSHKDESLQGVMDEMLPAAFDHLPEDDTTPIMMAFEDQFTLKELSDFTSTTCITGGTYNLDMTAEPLTTTKSLKTVYYNPSKGGLLEIEDALVEVQDWGLNEDAELYLMSMMMVWNTGEIAVPSIGAEDTDFLNVPTPGDIDDVIDDWVTLGLETGMFTSTIFMDSIRWINGVAWSSTALAKEGLGDLKFQFKVVQEGIDRLPRTSKAWKILDFVGESIDIIETILILGFTAMAIYFAATEFGTGTIEFNVAVAGAVLMMVYELVLLAISFIPVVGWIISLVISMLDLMTWLIGYLTGWGGSMSEALIGAIVDLIHDVKILTDVNIDMLRSWITIDDKTNNGLTAGDRIEFKSHILGKITGNFYGCTEYKTEDMNNAYITPTVKIIPPAGSASYGGSYTNELSNTTYYPGSHSYKINKDTLYEAGAWIEPGTAMKNYPVTVKLTYDYKMFYRERWWIFFVPYDVHGEKTGTQSSDLTTFYVDVLPNNIDDFANWRGKTALDHDRDGLLNTEEIVTHPWRYDTDADGLNDKYELDIGTDPVEFDTDRDGLLDKFELEYGTNATKRDTDEDGIPDYVEISGWVIAFNYLGGDDEFTMRVHSNPLESDTDGDGIDDRMEYYSNLNPRSQDTDGDGIVDEERPTVETHLQTEWETHGAFNNPRGLDVDSSGNVYVADTGNNRIRKFSSEGDFLTQWGSSGKGSYQFDEPRDVAVKSDDRIYVVDTGNDRIQKFNSGGTYLSSQSTLFNYREKQFTVGGAVYLGRSVALNKAGDVAVVGTYPSSGISKAFVFKRTAGIWNLEKELKPLDGHGYNFFGESVAIDSDGDTIVVGAPLQKLASDPVWAAGAAYLFERSIYTGAWTQKHKLVPSDLAIADDFGRTVSINGAGDTIAIGATKRSASDDKKGYVYTYVIVDFPFGGSIWWPLGKTTPWASHSADHDYFGGSIAINEAGNIMLVGAPGKDRVYYFYRDLPYGTWGYINHISWGYGTTKLCGNSVALDASGRTWVVGVPGDDGMGTDSGAVYVFNKFYGTLKKLTAPDAWGGDNFGRAVSISDNGEKIIIWAPQKINSINDKGAGYVFVNVGTPWSPNWKMQAKLLMPQATTGGWSAYGYGEGVAISGDGETTLLGHMNKRKVSVFRQTPPTSIAFDGSSGYAAFACDDYSFINKISLNTAGFGKDKLTAPRGLAVDGAGNIYAADYGADRIVKFNKYGNYVTAIFDGLSNPSDVAVDSEGNIYVADTGNSRIQKFDPYGMVRASWACSAQPRGIAVDADANLIVLEGSNLVKYSQIVVMIPPEVPETDDDVDNDGLDNDFESNGWDVTYTDTTGTYTIHVTSDPYLKDTDDDGLSDNEEFLLLSNPCNPDTDGDGASDFTESEYNTNINHYDTDSDGLDDNTELTYGSDPLSPDTEGDGLSDLEEFEQYSDPKNADTDGDGLNDSDELAFNSNLLDPDSDGDLVFDIHELEIGTDPQNNDTDSDGLSDGYELIYETDPANDDSDGDNISDGEEIQLKLNPLCNDTDGDGVLDSTEIEKGTNPLSSDSDGDGVPDNEDTDSEKSYNDSLILVINPSPGGNEFADSLGEHTNVTVVSPEELLMNYTDSARIVLVGRPEINDTIGNLISLLLEDNGDVLPNMIESDDNRFAVRYGVWTETQTIVMLSHPYPTDHLRVLELLREKTVTLKPDYAQIEYNRSLHYEVTINNEEFSYDFFMLDEMDIQTQVDTEVSAYVSEEVQLKVEMTKYNTVTTPSVLDHSTGLEQFEKDMGKYLEISVTDKAEDEPTDTVEWASIKIYYTLSDLDKTGDGDADDHKDLNESTLGLYWYDEEIGQWEKLSADMEWVDEIGLNTTNFELYGNSYEGCLWARITHLSLFGMAAITVQKPKEAIEDLIEDIEELDVPEYAKKDIDKSIKDLNKAIDEFEKNKIEKAIGKLEKAIKNLMKAQDKGADTQDVIDELVELVQDIVDKALADAIDMVGEDNKHIQKAHQHYDKALDELEDEKYDKAIKEFKKVYKEAMKARGEWVPDPFVDMLEETIDEVSDLHTEDLSTKAIGHLAKAEAELDKALSEADKDNMDKALDKIKKAINELKNAMKEDEEADTTLIIDSLMEGVEDTVYQKITDAESVAGAENKEVVKAWKKFNEAVTKSEAGSHKKAIDLFKEAVKSAEKAIT